VRGAGVRRGLTGLPGGGRGDGRLRGAGWGGLRGWLFQVALVLFRPPRLGGRSGFRAPDRPVAWGADLALF